MRRNFLKSAVIISGSAAVYPGCTPEGKPGKQLAGYPDKLPEPLPKGLEYILKVRDMILRILEEDSEKIERAADICAEAVINGKKVYYSIRGHNEPQCILEVIPGKPSFLLPLVNPSDHDALSGGDVLITVRTNQCAPALEKGTRVIGILMPFQPQKTQGQGITNIGYDGPYMEDICDVCIWDRTPYTVGILDFDQLPWKSVAAHGALDGIILGLIGAGTVDRLLKKGITVKSA